MKRRVNKMCSVRFNLWSLGRGVGAFVPVSRLKHTTDLSHTSVYYS